MIVPVSCAAASRTRRRHVPFATSLDALTVYVAAMLSVLPPVRLAPHQPNRIRLSGV